ncbi:MAG: esterase [Acidobacteria bacterium]|nr:esterase [Acidobacteriota bacterium]
MRFHLAHVLLLLLLAGGQATVPPRPAGRVESLTIVDATNHRSRRVWVHTPAGYDAAKGRPADLIVFLDGESYLEDIPAPAILDTLIAAGRIAPTVAVLVDTSQDRLGDLANRRKFADVAANELLPWIRSKWHVTNDPARVVVAGYSAGGLEAAHLAFRHPEQFGNVLSQSGAFWRGNEGASTPAEWLTDQYHHSPRLPVRFYLEVGAEETRPAANGIIFIEANRRLRDVLQAKGYPLRYVEVPGAKHEPAHWRSALAEGIGFLLGTMSR